MDPYEYQAGNLLRQHGVPVLDGAVATTPEKARDAAQSLPDAGSELVAVEAQVKTSGRDRVGGVKLARTAEEAEAHTRDALGMDIRDHTAHAVLISDGVDLDAEYYLSILLDHAERQHLVMYSREGGMDIETLVVECPGALAHIGIDPLEGITPAVSHRVVEAAGFEAGPLVDEVAVVIERLWEVFTAEDATLVEVNPLVKAADGRIIALDGKVILDDNSRLRHPAHAELVDNAATDPPEVYAREIGLNYVRPEGEAGVLGNGTGLVMPALDVVADTGECHGGMKPANPLDLEGGSLTEVMATGLEVVALDSQVYAILVNVLGGITSCGTATQGIATAVESLDGLPKPVVVRLDGNNADTGRAILADAVIEGVIVVDTMDGAAGVTIAITEKIGGRSAGREA